MRMLEQHILRRRSLDFLLNRMELDSRSSENHSTLNLYLLVKHSPPAQKLTFKKK